MGPAGSDKGAPGEESLLRPFLSPNHMMAAGFMLHLFVLGGFSFRALCFLASLQLQAD